MFRKRHERLTHLADAIAEAKEDRRAGDHSSYSSGHSPKPRRVPPDAFFQRIREMRAKGGSCEVSGR